MDANPGKYVSRRPGRASPACSGRTTTSCAVPPGSRWSSPAARPTAPARRPGGVPRRAQGRRAAARPRSTRRSRTRPTPRWPPATADRDRGAVRISDGAIMAAANGPDGGDVNLALTASVPPGSTFKMVTALGLLDKGAVTLDTPVNCPKTFTVEGRTFNNAGGYELGTVPFRTDFAKSCNTAFASLAPQLEPDLLPRPARRSGSAPPGTSAPRPTPARYRPTRPTSRPPRPRSVRVRPWSARWCWPARPPRSPAGPGCSRPCSRAAGRRAEADRPGRRRRPRHQAQPGSVGALRTMMREVVTAGTGHRAARRAGRAGLRQDRHRRVRQQPGRHPRLDDRLAGRHRVRGLRREGRLQLGDGRADRGGVPQGVLSIRSRLSGAARGWIGCRARPRRS